MNRKKLTVLTILVALLLAVSVGGTLAYLTDKTAPVENVFSPVDLDTEIRETVTNNVKSVIAVENVKADDHIPAYVRVGVSGNWVDAEGKIVEPWVGQNNLKLNEDYWFKGSDGYYYYKNVLAVGAVTENLIGEAITLSKDAAGNKLVVNVIHQSVQTEPKTVVEGIWPVTVNKDGTLQAK